MRFVQPGLFGLIVVCFFLPFAEVSCEPASVSTPMGAMDDEIGRQATVDLTGFELAFGSRFPPEWRGGDLAPYKDTGRLPAEPFALVALVAAAVGAGLGLLRRPRGRHFGGAIAAGIGGVALILLGVSPTLRYLGLARVTWRLGYWAVLALFIVAVIASYLALVRQRPPPQT